MSADKCPSISSRQVEAIVYCVIWERNMNQFFCDIATGILSNRKKKLFLSRLKTKFLRLLLFSTFWEKEKRSDRNVARSLEPSFSIFGWFILELPCASVSKRGRVKITLICKTTNLQENFISSWKVCTKARFDTEVRATWKWFLCRERRLYYTRYKPSAPKTRTKWWFWRKKVK